MDINKLLEKMKKADLKNKELIKEKIKRSPLIDKQKYIRQLRGRR